MKHPLIIYDGKIISRQDFNLIQLNWFATQIAKSYHDTQDKLAKAMEQWVPYGLDTTTK